WRQQDAVRLALARWLERATGFPALVPLRLDLGGFETLFHRDWARWRTHGSRFDMGVAGHCTGRGLGCQKWAAASFAPSQWEMAGVRVRDLRDAGSARRLNPMQERLQSRCPAHSG